jgi:hypothetical protein
LRFDELLNRTDRHAQAMNTKVSGAQAIQLSEKGVSQILASAHREWQESIDDGLFKCACSTFLTIQDDK